MNQNRRSNERKRNVMRKSRKKTHQKEEEERKKRKQKFTFILLPSPSSLSRLSETRSSLSCAAQSLASHASVTAKQWHS